MPAETRIPTNVRLAPETLAQVDEIAENFGMKRYRVFEEAIDDLHRSLCRSTPASPRLPVAGLSPNRRESNRQAAERELMRPAARPAGTGRNRTGKPAT